MSGLARQRLAEERKTFRKEKEFGFSAKPVKTEDGCEYSRFKLLHVILSSFGICFVT